VTGDHEALVSELLHHLDEIPCHLAKAEIDVIGARVGQRAVTVAAQVGKNDVVVFGQSRGDLVPAGVILGIAVDEQQRRARTTVAQPNDGTTGAHIDVTEAWEMCGHLCRSLPRRITAVIGFVAAAITLVLWGVSMLIAAPFRQFRRLDNRA
jgi:hypothetical protein